MAKIKLKDNYPGFSMIIDGITLNKGDDFAEVNESLELQNAIDSDYVEAYEEKKEIKEEKVKDGEEVWIFAEQRNNNLSRVVFELLGKAQELANKLNVKVAAILACESDSGLSKSLAEYGADKVYLIESRLLKDYTTGLYAKVISELINKEEPQIMVYGATNIGRDLAQELPKG